MEQKFIAVHTVQMMVKGEPTSIAPSFPLTLSDEKQINQLMTAGAIREPEENEMRLFKEGIPSGTADQTQNPAPGAVDLTKLKKAELLKLAADEQIAVDETATNAALVKSIEDGRKAKAETDTDGLV